MKKVLKPQRRSTEPEVEVPEKDTIEEMWEQLKVQEQAPEKWKRVIGRDKVEHIMIEWRALHFIQAAETPVDQGRWERRLNILDPANNLEEVFKGEYESPDLEVSECIEWLEGLKRKEGVEETNIRGHI